MLFVSNENRQVQRPSRQDEKVRTILFVKSWGIYFIYFSSKIFTNWLFGRKIKSTKCQMRFQKSLSWKTKSHRILMIFLPGSNLLKFTSKTKWWRKVWMSFWKSLKLIKTGKRKRQISLCLPCSKNLETHHLWPKNTES